MCPIARRRSLRPILVTCVLALAHARAGRAASTAEPGFRPMVTDPNAVFTVPIVPEPNYLTMVLDPTFSTWILRIGGDTGKPLGTLNTSWAAVARHVYSKQQPWNSNGTLVSIENRGGAVSPLLLDGRTYLPLRGPCSNYDRWDYRWH